MLASRLDGVSVRFGTSVREVVQGGARVFVRFTDSTSASYDLVVGADGIRSALRRLALGEARPRFRGQLGWRFLARATATTPVDAWTVYLGAGSAFLLVPIADDAVYCYADRMTRSPGAESSSPDVMQLRERFRRFPLPVQSVLDQLESADQLHYPPAGSVETPAVHRAKVRAPAAHREDVPVELSPAPDDAVNIRVS